MPYKINLHAHSIFSDGYSSPYVMAKVAHSLGFVSLIVTDHYYGPAHPEFINPQSMKTLKKACKEASSILPVIVGLEIPFMGQEVLVFGGAALKDILEYGLPTMKKLLYLKEYTGCAVVLCHPDEDFEYAIPAIDGYERFNKGRDMFSTPGGKPESLGKLVELPAWSNSDAHIVEELNTGHNIVDSKITTEKDLIKYIRRGKQPELIVNGDLYVQDTNK